jgi:hypothetical protein
MAQNKKGIKNILDSARDGDLQAIKTFISEKKDLNVQGPDGRTILINAAANRHGEIVKLLLDSGANVNLATNSQKTVLNYSLCSAFGFAIGGKRGDSTVLQIVKLLTSYHCSISNMDIAFAILFHEPEVLTLLLKQVSKNRKLLTDAIEYVDKNAFEYDVEDSTVEKNLNLVRACLKHI